MELNEFIERVLYVRCVNFVYIDVLNIMIIILIIILILIIIIIIIKIEIINMPMMGSTFSNRVGILESPPNFSTYRERQRLPFL